MGVTIHSMVDDVKGRLAGQVDNGVFYAATVLQRLCRDAVGVPVVKVGRRVTERSKPGEPPRKDTGFGQSSIAMQKPGPRRRRVGIIDNGDYMARHELGLARGGAVRPWLIATLNRNEDEIANAFRTGAQQVA